MRFFTGKLFLLTAFLIVPVLFLFNIKDSKAQTSPITALSVEERQKALQNELNQVLAEIEEQKKILASKQQEGASLERDIAILNAEIKEAKLKIQAHEIAIQRLGKDINTKTDSINILIDKSEEAKSTLSHLLRKTNQIDDYTLTEIVLSNKVLSDFLQDLDSYYYINQSLNTSLEHLKKVKTETEDERTALDHKRDQEIDVKVSVETEKRVIEKAESEKNRLLKLSKAEQSNYKGQIALREMRANQIKAALFALRDSAAIPFGKALEYAISAGAKTGVRPAFILGILTQESDLGKNVGTCNRAGDPPEKNWKAVMKPERDQEPFKRITAALGLNPDTMPVSCPIGKGWGGAMGPSQFIPSTWELYAPRIASITGSSYANPWDARDAITATAIYVADLGANQGGYTAERTAALKYYAGGNWKKPQNQFYGDQVMTKTTNIQENMINPLQGL